MTLGKGIAASLLASVFAMLLASVAQAQETKSCEDWRCEFQAALESKCQCGDQSNHGRYVSCVAHEINSLVDQGMPTNCKGKLQRCAARSVCGKQSRGFHTCTTFEYSTCTIDPLTQLGACSHDPTVACAVDTDCVVSSRCRTTRRPESCPEAPAGALDLSPSCCSSCTVTSSTVPNP
jgi:hypothetical protein